MGKKPGFFDSAWVARNRVFATNFVTVQRFGGKEQHPKQPLNQPDRTRG